VSEKVIFVDRDGVINEDKIGGYITRWEEFRFIDGTIEALKQLSDAGFEIVIISNQAGIGDGVYSEKSLNEITKKMLDTLKKRGVKIRGIYYCLHGKQEGCDCRKPKTGLFEQAARKIDFDPGQAYFFGDKASDMEAGLKFGLRNVYVLTGHGEADREKLKEIGQPDTIVPTITEAAQYVLKQGSEAAT